MSEENKKAAKQPEAKKEIKKANTPKPTAAEVDVLAAVKKTKAINSSQLGAVQKALGRKVTVKKSETNNGN